MKKTCITHIGLHKTGSSSIQNTLYKNRELLKSDFDINYYDTQANHGTIFSLFAKNLEHYITLKLLGKTDGDTIGKFKFDLKAHLNHALQTNTSSYFVISGEDLSLLEKEEVGSFYEFLNPFFDDFQIYAYVRDPMSYANSVGQQHVKAGMTFSDIERHTFGPEDSDHQSPISLSASVRPFYKARIEPYQQAFGADNVTISNFSAIRERKEDVFSHFMRLAFNITTLPQSFETLRVNESLGSDAVYLAEALNNEIPFFINNTLNPERALGLIQHLFSLQSKESFVLPEFDFAALASVVERDVIWLKTVTDNQIDFTDMKPPEKSARLWPNLIPIARSINTALIKEGKSTVSRDMFRTLWLCSQNPDAAKKTINCENLVRRCFDAKAMANFAHNLKVLGFFDFARHAVDRAIYLLKDDADKVLYNRMISMKKQIVASMESID